MLKEVCTVHKAKVQQKMEADGSVQLQKFLLPEVRSYAERSLHCALGQGAADDAGRRQRAAAEVPAARGENSHCT
jgi:hypothetical protein